MIIRGCLSPFMFGVVVSLTINPILLIFYLNFKNDLRDLPPDTNFQIYNNGFNEIPSSTHKRYRRHTNDYNSDPIEKQEFSHLSELESLSLLEPRRVTPPESVIQRASKNTAQRQQQYRPRFLAHELNVLEHLLIVVYYSPTSLSTSAILRAYNRTFIEPLGRAFGSTGPKFAFLPFDEATSTRSSDRGAYPFLEWFLREHYRLFSRRYRYVFVHPLSTYVSVERLLELIRRTPLPFSDTDSDSSTCATCAFGVPVSAPRPSSLSDGKLSRGASTKAPRLRLTPDALPPVLLDADSKLQSSTDKNEDEAQPAVHLCDAALGMLLPLTTVELLYERLRNCRAPPAGVAATERTCIEQTMADVKCISLLELYALEFDELDVFSEAAIARLLNIVRPDEASDLEPSEKLEHHSDGANADRAQLIQSADDELANSAVSPDNATALEAKLLAAFDEQSHKLATRCRERLRAFGDAAEYSYEYVLVVRGLPGAFAFYYVHRLYVGTELALLESTPDNHQTINSKESSSSPNGRASSWTGRRAELSRSGDGESDSINTLESELKRRAALSPLPAESDVWARGVHYGPPPRNRFEAIPWQKLNRTHILFRNEHSLIDPLSPADAIDFERVLEFAREEFNRIQNISNDMDSNLSWEFDELLNGYRRIDPLSGVEYLLDIRFRRVGKTELASHHFHVLKALSRIENAPMPYNPESAQVTVLLIAREPRAELHLRVRDALSRRMRLQNASYDGAQERLALLRSVMEEVDATAADIGSDGLAHVLRVAAAANEFCGGRLTVDSFAECERLISSDQSRFRRLLLHSPLSSSSDTLPHRTPLESLLAFTRNLESTCFGSGSGSGYTANQNCFSDGRLRVIIVLLYASTVESAAPNDTDNIDEPYDYFSPLKAELSQLQSRVVSSSQRPIRWFNAISRTDGLAASKQHDSLDQQLPPTAPSSYNSSSHSNSDSGFLDFKLSELLINRELEYLRASKNITSNRNQEYTPDLQEQLDVLRLLVESRQVDMRNPVFFVPPTAILSTDILNRVRIHVIPGRQAFFPIGFRLFHPLLSELESSRAAQSSRVWDASRPLTERVQKGAGAFDELDFECTAVIAGDLLAADQRVRLLTSQSLRNESASATWSAAGTGTRQQSTPTGRQLGSLYALIELHAPQLHLLRPVEPNLVLECCSRDDQAGAESNEDSLNDSHQLETSAERRAARLGTQQKLSAMAQLIRHFLKNELETAASHTPLGVSRNSL